MFSRLSTYFLVFSIHYDDGVTLELNNYQALGNKLCNFNAIYHPFAHFSPKCRLPPTILQLS